MTSIRKSSDTEFWTAIQRLWTFDEPFSRWMRLRKSMAKIVPSLAFADYKPKVTAEEETLFDAIYGGDSQKNRYANFLFTLVFSVAEMIRFQDSAFTYCSETTSNGRSERHETDKLLDYSCEQRKFSPPQIAFLRHRLRSCPDWSRLLSDGPWSNDQRVRLIRQVLTQSPKIDPAPAAKHFDDTEFEITVQNLKALEQAFKTGERALRSQLPAGFLPKRVVLVEGATEQILLPHFAQCVKADFNVRAISFVPAGGANQVSRRYLSLRQLLALPIDCILDGDVLSQANFISTQLKEGDRLFVLQSGAIEEAFGPAQIASLVNVYFEELGGPAIYAPISSEELGENGNQAGLEKLWRKRQRGSFDKTGFAKVAAEQIRSAAQIPAEIRELIVNLCDYQTNASK